MLDQIAGFIIVLLAKKADGSVIALGYNSIWMRR